MLPNRVSKQREGTYNMVYNERLKLFPKIVAKRVREKKFVQKLTVFASKKSDSALLLRALSVHPSLPFSAKSHNTITIY